MLGGSSGSRKGDAGMAPVLSGVIAGAKRLLWCDWVQGAPPPNSGYVTAAQLNADQSQAIDFRGDKGDPGDPGAAGTPGIGGWIKQTGNFNALVNKKYSCAAGITATLPASAAQGDEIQILNETSLLVNNITIARNGGTINGSAVNLVLSLVGGEIQTLVCINATGPAWRSAP